MQEAPLLWEIASEVNDTHIMIKGELSRFTLLPLWQALVLQEKRHFPYDKSLIWHFNEISHLDSAGFALLCDLLRQGENAQGQQIADCSPQFLTLADLFGLSPWVKGFLNPHHYINGNL